MRFFHVNVDNCYNIEFEKRKAFNVADLEINRKLNINQLRISLKDLSQTPIKSLKEYNLNIYYEYSKVNWSK